MNWKQAVTLGLLAPGVWGGPKAEWETLFEGTVTSFSPGMTYNNAGLARGSNGWMQGIDPMNAWADIFTTGDMLRLTVDGDTQIFFVTEHWYNPDYIHPNYCVGNMWLADAVGEKDYTDTGYNFCLCLDKANLYVYARNRGTYNIKIEKKVN